MIKLGEIISTVMPKEMLLKIKLVEWGVTKQLAFENATKSNREENAVFSPKYDDNFNDVRPEKRTMS